MATRTENYHLVKPDRKESVNVGVLNNNWDITDAIVADLQAQHDAKVAELNKRIDGLKTDLDDMAKEIMGYIERGKTVWTEKNIPVNSSVVLPSAALSKITAFKYGRLVVIAFSCTLAHGIGKGGSAVLATGLPADLKPYGDSPFSGHGIRFNTQKGNGGYTYGGVLVVSKTSITAYAPQVVNATEAQQQNIDFKAYNTSISNAPRYGATTSTVSGGTGSAIVAAHPVNTLNEVISALEGSAAPAHNISTVLEAREASNNTYTTNPPFMSVSGQVAYVTA